MNFSFFESSLMAFDTAAGYDFPLWANLAAQGAAGESRLRETLSLDAIASSDFMVMGLRHFDALYPDENPVEGLYRRSAESAAAHNFFIARIVNVFADDLFSDPARNPGKVLSRLLQFRGKDANGLRTLAISEAIDRQTSEAVSEFLEASIPNLLRHSLRQALHNPGSDLPEWGLWSDLSPKTRAQAISSPSLWTTLFQADANGEPGPCKADGAGCVVDVIAGLGRSFEELRPMLASHILPPKQFMAFARALAELSNSWDMLHGSSPDFLKRIERFEAWLPLTPAHWAQMSRACSEIERHGHSCSMLRAVVDARLLSHTLAQHRASDSELASSGAAAPAKRSSRL